MKTCWHSSRRSAGKSAHSEPSLTETTQRLAELEAGAVTITQPTMPSPAIPFGCMKNSGYGREMGADGIREITNHKTINGARVGEVA